MGPKGHVQRVVRLTIRLTTQDAERLTAAAWERRRSQTAIVEELLRTLPEPSDQYWQAARASMDE